MTTTEQISQTVELLGGMYRALAAIKERELPEHPALYAVLAEGALVQIQEFTRQLDDITGVTLALERQSDIWLRLEGSQESGVDLPARVLSACLNTLQTGVWNIAVALTSRIHTEDSRSQFLEDLRRACDLYMMTLPSGGGQIGLRLPLLEELTGDYDSLRWQEATSAAQRAVEELMGAAAWLATSNSPEPAQEPQTDTQGRRPALETLHQLLQLEAGEIQTLQITGRHCPIGQPIRIVAQPTARLKTLQERCYLNKR